MIFRRFYVIDRVNPMRCSLHPTVATSLLAAVAMIALGSPARASVMAAFEPSMTGPNVELTDDSFFEGSGLLGSDLTLDITPGGGAGTVMAGEFVASYFFEVDRRPNNGNRDYKLTLTFDMPVIGVIGLETSLDASALVLATPFDLKTPTNGQQLNITGRDDVMIDNNVVMIDGRIGNGRDPFRVIIQAQDSGPSNDLLTPEPGSFFCWAGLVGLAAFRRRQAD